jgi:hypothetical protein
VLSTLVRAWAATTILAAVAVPGCSGRPEAARFRLIEKRPYQALYGPDGRLERILHDGDGDRRADAIVFYGARGEPTRAEIDSDGDGVIDRWETIIGKQAWVEEIDTDGDLRPNARVLHGPDDGRVP